MNVTDAKHAVGIALDFFRESGIDADASDVRVEELALSDDESTWEVTLSYRRPDRRASEEGSAASFLRTIQGTGEGRVYKTFSIRTADSQVTSMRIRTLASAR